MIPLNAFLHDLRTRGRVRVGHDVEPGDAPPEALRDLDAEARQRLAPGPPPLDRSAAAWAARILYQACRLYAHRDLGVEEVERRLAVPCPSPPSPSTCYSVDLTLCHLPDVFALARGISRGDPLIEHLLRLGTQWPLSSVGLEGLGDLEEGTFLDDSCLRTLYADRILAAQDVTRLGNPRVRAAVEAALGAHPDLAPRIADALARAGS